MRSDIWSERGDALALIDRVTKLGLDLCRPLVPWLFSAGEIKALSQTYAKEIEVLPET